MLLAASTPFTSKSSHQLPMITKKSTHVSSPLLEKMKSLHRSNLKTIQKQHIQSDNILRNYQQNKNEYFKTIHKQKQNHSKKVSQDLRNKSSLLQKQNFEKTKRHNQSFRNYVSLTKQKIKNSYLRQKAKIQQAQQRKSQLILSSTKHVFVKKPNYRKLYLEELNKSQQLQKVTIQKLINAEHRRKQLKQQKQKAQNDKLNKSIYKAIMFVQSSTNQLSQKLLEKSIHKMNKSFRLIQTQKQRSRSQSESSRKSNNQKLTKAKLQRNQQQEAMIQRLETILQQKNTKISTVNQRKTHNLQVLASNLKKSRSIYTQKAQERSKSSNSQLSQKRQEIMHQNLQKWKFLTGLKNQFTKVKTKNLYQTQQMSLRA